MIRSIWTALFVLLVVALLAGSSRAQQRKFNPLGFCTSSSVTAATGLSAFTGTACANQPNSTLNAYTYLLICAYNAGIVYRDDGIAPTATPGSGGQGLSAGTCIGYNGTPASLQFIQQTATATVGVTVYQ